MDAKERLRVYLEQRREMGESEFMLDSMPVEDVLRMLGDKQAAETVARPIARPQAPRYDEPRDGAPVRAPRPEVPVTGDWKETLKAMDATPAAPPPAAKVTVPVVASDLTHLDTLEAVAAAVAKCTGCSLHKTARNHVPGEGNPQAGFVVVGEAPGEKEDELGRPFVGRSGDLLTKILEAIQLSRSDVFICNVLKHRPPGNRNPTPEEVTVCSPFLRRQLELLRPRVILALGTFAAQTLLQSKEPIGKLRGIEHRYHGVPLIVTYHPAALLRNPAYKRPTWEDVQLARRIFDSATPA